MIYLITEACPNATGFFSFCVTRITLLNPGRHALIPGSKQSVTGDAAMDNMPSSLQRREYMSGLYKRNSVVALINGVLELIFVFFGIVLGLNKTVTELGENIFASFTYFTNISNTLAAISVAFVIPYAVEGIRKKRFTLPHWVSVLLFASANSVFIVMTVALLFMSWLSPDDAFGGGGVFTHVFCPIFIISSFLLIENGCKYTFRECILACVPFFSYLSVYLVMVVFIGYDNGGWRDLYHVMDYLPPFVAVPILLIYSCGTSFLIAKVSNFLKKKRKDKLFLYWDKDIQPVEVYIEAYGLGIMMAEKRDKESIEVPYDILEELAKRYDLDPLDLLKGFVKGLEVGTRA